MSLQVIRLGDILEKTIVIPVASLVTDVDNVLVNITPPLGWAIKSGTASVGSLSTNIWTIPTLIAGQSAELLLELEAVVACPEGRVLFANISTTDPNGNTIPSDDVAETELDFITCCDLKDCSLGDSDLISVECYTGISDPIVLDNLSEDSTGNLTLIADNTNFAQILVTSPPVESIIDSITLRLESTDPSGALPSVGFTLLYEDGSASVTSSSTVAVPADPTDVVITFPATTIPPNTGLYFALPDVNNIAFAMSVDGETFPLVNNSNGSAVSKPLGAIGSITFSPTVGEFLVLRYLNSDGTSTYKAVNKANPADIVELGDAIPTAWIPCPDLTAALVPFDPETNSLVSEDVQAAIEELAALIALGSDDQTALEVPVDNSGVLEQNNVQEELEAIRVELANAATSSVGLAPTSGYQHSDGATNPTLQEIQFRFDDSNVGISGELNLVDGDNRVTSTVNLCNPNCPPILAQSGDVVLEVPECRTFYGTVASPTTGCSEGVSVIKYVEGSASNGSVVIGAGGEFAFTFEDCSTGNPASFIYSVQCSDGTMATGLVTLNLPEEVTDAVDDVFASQGGTTLVSNVLVNDTLCPSGATTAEIASPPASGSVIMNPNGKFTYSPALGFVGADTFTYNILCNGVISDTAQVIITVIEATAMDDSFIVPNGGTLSGANAVANDSGCGPSGVTTTQFSNITAANGTIVGTPDNFTYTPNPGFIGVGFVKYEILCNGVVFDEATIFLGVTTAIALPNSFDTQLGTPITDNVGLNDLSCTNGGMTSYHLVSDDTVDGAASEQAIQCEEAGKPGGVITAWNQATGEFTLSPTDGFSGDACFDYFIRCTSPDGGFYDSPATTVTISVVPTLPKISVTQTLDDLDTGLWSINIEGNLDEGGAKKILDGTETLNLVIPEIGVDVDFVLGQDITTPAGVAGDSGTTSWSKVSPYLTGASVLSLTDLFAGLTTLSFLKKDWATDNGFLGTDVAPTVATDLTWDFTLTTISGDSVSDDVVLDTRYIVREALGIFIGNRNNIVTSIGVGVSNNTVGTSFSITSPSNPPITIFHPGDVVREFDGNSANVQTFTQPTSATSTPNVTNAAGNSIGQTSSIFYDNLTTRGSRIVDNFTSTARAFTPIINDIRFTDAKLLKLEYEVRGNSIFGGCAFTGELILNKENDYGLSSSNGQNYFDYTGVGVRDVVVIPSGVYGTASALFPNTATVVDAPGIHSVDFRVLGGDCVNFFGEEWIIQNVLAVDIIEY